MGYNKQAGFSGALGGAGSGAAIGTVVAPGIGTAIGAGVGALAGAAGGFLGSEAGGLTQDQIQKAIDDRRIQINTFGEQLARARAQYLNQLSNLQTLTMSRFGSNLETQFGAKGLNVGGGAFQSALARRTVELQAEGSLEEAKMTREDLGSVAGLKQGAWPQGLSLQQHYGDQQLAQKQAMMSGLGSLAGSGINYAIQSKLLGQYLGGMKDMRGAVPSGMSPYTPPNIPGTGWPSDQPNWIQ